MFRSLFDLDDDYEVSVIEADRYLETVNGPLDTVEGNYNVSLDGNDPISIVMEFDVDGAVGEVTDDKPIYVTLNQTICFPEHGDNATHGYAGTGDVMFIGGDQIWEAEYSGVDDPWDGMLTWDDLWEIVVEVHLSVRCPEGWRFNTSDWPWYHIHDVNLDRTSFYSGVPSMSYYENETFGLMDSFNITQAIDVDIRPTALDYYITAGSHTLSISMIASFENESETALLEYIDIDDSGQYEMTDHGTIYNMIRRSLYSTPDPRDILLNGKQPTDTDIEIEFIPLYVYDPQEDPLTFFITERITYEEPTEPGQRRYSTLSSWDIIGGIDNWDHYFILEDDPWEMEFIREGDPWAEDVDVSFRFRTFDGWEILEEDWPEGLDGYLSIDQTEIRIDGDDIHSSYNSTFGSLSSITIVEREILPVNMSILVEFESVSSVSYTISGTYEGKAAYFFQQVLDMDGDDIVSSWETDTYIDYHNEMIANNGVEANITLDGKGPDSVFMMFRIEGAEGSLDGLHQVTITYNMTALFPVREDVTSYTYDFGSFAEFVGGDGPWKDEFSGGYDIFEDEYMRGDEPFDDRVDVMLQLRAPKGHIFHKKEWDPDMKDLLDPSGTLIEMNGSSIRSKYSSTMGAQDIITLKEKTEGGDGPGFGTMMVIAAIAVMVLASRRNRR